MKSVYPVLLFLSIPPESSLGFHVPIYPFPSPGRSRFQPFEAAKGGASKGFGGKISAKPKRPNKASVVKQLQKKYGGTSPEDIARGTQRIIDKRLQNLSPHLQEALNLYQYLRKWNYQINIMSASPSSHIRQEQLDEVKRAQEELDKLLKTHSLTTTDLHNVLQAATWDASADAKVARSIRGDMPTDIQRKVQKGCDSVATAIGNDGKILDVGCGYGVTIPFMKKSGIAASQMYGIDLSTEMIRNAEVLYPSSNWTAGDFFAYQPSTAFDAILFCSSLHDLPDPEKALTKAASLLNPEGIIVVLHAQGASQVLNQVRSNPVLVQRGLPTAVELRSIPGLKLIADPAAPSSQQESRDGYIAILKKYDHTVG
ncbi:unnamed protein product [Cylindrotheca closterium]|uniref:Methyltransferase type 11 domain-containing protein n=1 Tax=Cylindrotheca closterium TaxID=2856 RepID=A0AAD2CMY9_9STRA|nr:unnamed protein product [Cylindrotheca closterium]